MKRFGEIASKLTHINLENGQTSSTPDDQGIQTPIDIICTDPNDPSQPCPICDGKGVIMLDVPVSDPRYGKLHRCPNNRIEYDTDRHARLRRIGNLEFYKDKTFENFDTNPNGSDYSYEALESLRMALTSAQSFAQNPSGWLVFEGAYGCGKTHLAVAIANTRLEQYGDEVLFTTAPDLLDYLRTTFTSSAEISYDESFDRIRNIPLLVLDDLGVENPSGWAKEKLFQLLNFRYSANLPTVITTNMALDELDPRISSRMLESQRVFHLKITAPDFRPSMAKRSDQVFSQLDLYQHMTFESFDIRSRNPVEERDLDYALKYAAAFTKSPQGWIFFMGAFGSGKTHLAAAIANELRYAGYQVMFTTVPDLMDYMRITFDPKSNVRFDKRFQEIKNTPILILDDVSLESATSWAKEKLFQIIDYRYVRKLPTVFTSVKSMNDIDDRLQTRLADTRLCKIVAVSDTSYVERRKSLKL